MPPKRRASAADRATEELKKARSVIDETAEEFLCAITMALPVKAQRAHVRPPTVYPTVYHPGWYASLLVFLTSQSPTPL